MRSAILFALLALVPPADEQDRVVALDLERLESPDPFEAIHLGRAGAVEAVPALWRLWRSEDRGCRWTSLNALAALGDEGAVGWILDELGSGDPGTILAAIQRLEAVRRPDLAFRLEPLFGDDRIVGGEAPCDLGVSLAGEAKRVYGALTRSLSSSRRPAARPSSRP